MSALGGPRDGGGPPARALLPALQTRATPRRYPRTSTVDHDQSPSTATARSLEYPSVTTDEAQLKIRASVPTGAASNTTREDADTPTTPTTGIHATDQLLVSTTPYYAHLYPLLLRARGALQDLDRTPQEPGHYNDYHDTTAGIHATDQLLVSTTPYYAHLYPLLLRARGALHDLDRTPQEPGRYDDYHDSLGSTGLRPIPPHYYRDPAHGPGVGSGLLPRVPPPTCSRPVSGVGLGPFVMRLLCCSLPAPARRQFFALRFATVCH